MAGSNLKWIVSKKVYFNFFVFFCFIVYRYRFIDPRSDHDFIVISNRHWIQRYHGFRVEIYRSFDYMSYYCSCWVASIWYCWFVCWWESYSILFLIKVVAFKRRLINSEEFTLIPIFYKGNEPRGTLTHDLSFVRRLLSQLLYQLYFIDLVCSSWVELQTKLNWTWISCKFHWINVNSLKKDFSAFWLVLPNDRSVFCMMLFFYPFFEKYSKKKPNQTFHKLKLSFLSVNRLSFE